MTLSVALPESTVSVVPGRSALLRVRVTNTGPTAQLVRLDAAGRAADWLRLAPPPDADPGGDPAGDLRLAAGQTATLPLLVAPPRGAAAAGQLVPFTLRASTPGGSRATATGLVVVAAPVPVTAALAPESATGTGASLHVLHLTTAEPGGVLVTLRASSPSSGAEVGVDPVAVRVEPGTPGRAEVRVRPRSPALTGPRRHPFSVVWESDGPDGLARGEVSGTLVQTPRLPPAVAGLLAVTLAALLVLAGLTAWDGLRGGDSSDSPGSAEADARGGGADRRDLDLSATWVVVAQQRKEADPQREAAQQAADDVGAGRGLRVRVLDGADIGGNPQFWVVVVDGFDDRAAAQEFCRQRAPRDCSVRP